MNPKVLPDLLFLFLFLALTPQTNSQQTAKQQSTSPKGHLFIIGGGEKTEGLMQEMLKVSGLSKEDYVIVLPMSSEEPDSSVIFASEDFASVGIKHVVGFNFKENEFVAPSKIDSIQKAKLIFITGGDQTRFMKVVGHGPIYRAIHNAYQAGATIAGTSAGAAVMSKQMITGNALKYPEYTGKYPCIEADNIEISEGLGLVTNMIVDQHFIKRQRLNRLLAVTIENPNELCVGIDESTAIIVSADSFRVAGENQVIVISNPRKSKTLFHNLLGGKGLNLDILLPGETYMMIKAIK